VAGTEGDTVAEVAMVAAEVTADASWAVSDLEVIGGPNLKTCRVASDASSCVQARR